MGHIKQTSESEEATQIRSLENELSIKSIEIDLLEQSKSLAQARQARLKLETEMKLAN